MAWGRAVVLAWALALVATASAGAQTPLFGYNDNSTLQRQFTPEEDARLLSMAGANTMRIVVDWTWVEGRRGDLDLAIYDPIYQAMLDRGIRPLLNLMGSPRWAWPPWVLCLPLGSSCHMAPGRNHDGAWANFVRAVARRYPRALGIEIWNEPNLKAFFGPSPDPQRYTELLRIGRDAVKSVVPEMPVIGGALAPVFGSGGSGDIGMRPFLRAMYANGARWSMDGVSVHPYPNTRGHAGVYDAINAVIETRDAARHAAPLWLTELGISSGFGYSEDAQAAFLGGLVPRLLRRPGVAAVYLHTLADPRDEGFTIESGYGILGAAGEPKPAFCAIVVHLLTTSGCDQPVVSERAEARWTAQERLQQAAEAALAWRRQAGTYSGFTAATLEALDPSLAVAENLHVEPGPGAEPHRVAVLAVDGRPGVLRLCNTSTDTRSYCMTIVDGGPWGFTSLEGTIAETAAATDAGSSQHW